MARVDVIVPCYNYGHYLRSCVESVLQQQDVDLRVLILDDASPDETPEVGQDLARADARITYRRHAHNAGHIPTFNEGIDWVSGDYYLLLSADDYLLPGALARAAVLMDRHPEVGFVFGAAKVLDGEGQLKHVRPFSLGAQQDEMIIPGLEFIERSGAGNLVLTPTVVIRTSLQKQAGGYRYELLHTGDMEMWLRLAARAAVGYVDAEQAVYRQHATNMSRDYFAAMLPDIEQRKNALDLFFEGSAPLLPDPERLRSEMHLDLARRAVGRASQAFNLGEAELSNQLLKYARSVHPSIVKSAPWLKLGLKRRMGLRAWRYVAQFR